MQDRVVVDVFTGIEYHVQLESPRSGTKLVSHPLAIKTGPKGHVVQGHAVRAQDAQKGFFLHQVELKYARDVSTDQS